MDRRPDPSERRPRQGYAQTGRAPARRPSGYGNRPVRDQYPPRSRGPERRASQPNRRRKKKRLHIKPQLLIICAVLLFAAIYVLSAAFTSLTNSGTYCDNVTINGISLTKYGKEEGAQYIADQFSDQLSATYTLTYGDKSWTFTPSDFNAQLDIGTAAERAWNMGHIGNIFERANDIKTLKSMPIDIKVDLTYDESLIEKFVDGIYDELYIAPIDAVVTVATDQPYITGDSSEGQALDRDVTIGMIKDLIETGTGSTVLPVLAVEPNISSTRAAEGLDIIVQYSTDVSFRGYNSRYNVRKALTFFNGMCVAPGETINFNEVVGPRTEERGWAEATEYAGHNTQKGFGGGVCQASTTLYGAVLKAGMDIIERNPHSMTVTYVEPSLDAAVFYGDSADSANSKNMIFQNNTENAIYIYTEVTKETATVTIYGIRPEYRYELYSNIISQDASATNTDYVYDTEGTHVYYTTDTPVLYSEGHAACSSEGWLISYDWDTGEEVTRKQLTNDIYASGTDIYWVGIHNEDGSVIEKTNS